MFKNLNLNAINVHKLSLPKSIELAQQTGFDGIDFDIREAAKLADQVGISGVRRLFEEVGIQPAQWGLPLAWNRPEWEQELAELPRLAAIGRALGALRTTTWCPPTSAEREFEENFEWHVRRFRAIAEILKSHEIRFGLEFVGPQTMRPPDQHDFIYTMDGLLDLIRTIDVGNAGLLLDSYHLHTSGGSVDDLDKLTAADIVAVHVNDAPAGLTMVEYLDGDRRLPMETGVIDLPAIMKKLVKLGYDGPVTPEPFSKRLEIIESPLEAAQLTTSYMDKLWQASGLT